MRYDNISFPIENKETLQREDFIEWMTAIMVSRIQIPFRVVVGASMAFYGIILLQLLLGMRLVSVFYIMEVSVCLAIALFFRFVVPNVLGRLRYRQACFTSKGSQKSILFYEDHLELKAEDTQLTALPYTMVKKMTVSKHLLILVFPHMVHCVARKDGFSGNALEAIQAQIRLRAC